MEGRALQKVLVGDVVICFARYGAVEWVSFGAWEGGFTRAWEQGSEGKGSVLVVCDHLLVGI